MLCKNCRRTIPDDSSVCPYCRKKINSGRTPTEPGMPLFHTGSDSAEKRSRGTDTGYVKLMDILARLTLEIQRICGIVKKYFEKAVMRVKSGFASHKGIAPDSMSGFATPEVKSEMQRVYNTAKRHFNSATEKFKSASSSHSSGKFAILGIVALAFVCLLAFSLNSGSSDNAGHLLSDLKQDTGKGGTEEGIHYFRVYTKGRTQYYESSREYLIDHEDDYFWLSLCNAAFYDAYGHEDTPYMTLNRKTDKLALVDTTSVEYAPAYSGYMFPFFVETKNSNLSLKRLHDEDAIAWDTVRVPSSGYIEKIDNSSPSEYFDELETLAIYTPSGTPRLFWPASYGKKHTLGYWSGTDWIEETITADLRYFIVPDGNSSSLPIETTENGYFFADITDLEPGMYFFYGADKLIVNIV